MFVDKAKITICSGNGGNGIISFLRLKFIPKGGPNGGDGGAGGNIFINGVDYMNSLIKFNMKKIYRADNGQNGMSNNKTGKNAKHLYLDVPVGTQIWTEDKKFLIYDCVKKNDAIPIAEGGKGGKGNTKFKSSRNKTPYIRQEGRPGYEMNIWLILKTIADIGIIGKPNAGKSSLLARLTNASPLIANYPFSTLSPNIGRLHKDVNSAYTLADIPGLIEDAHLGKGLGHEFLQHIERCKVLLHIVDGTSENIQQDIKDIEKELYLYNADLLQKKIITVINKSDLLTNHTFDQNDILVSAATGEGIDRLIAIIFDIMRTDNDL